MDWNTGESYPTQQELDSVDLYALVDTEPAVSDRKITVFGCKLRKQAGFHGEVYSNHGAHYTAYTILWRNYIAYLESTMTGCTRESVLMKARMCRLVQEFTLYLRTKWNHEKGRHKQHRIENHKKYGIDSHSP